MGQYPQRNAAPLYLIHTLLALSPYTALNIPLLNCSIFYCTVHLSYVLHCTPLYYPSLHIIILHCTSFHYIALYCTALHCTALHILVCAVLYLTVEAFPNNICLFRGADICCTTQFVMSYCLVQCSALYFHAVQYSTVQCSAVQRFVVSLSQP